MLNGRSICHPQRAFFGPNPVKYPLSRRMWAVHLRFADYGKVERFGFAIQCPAVKLEAV